MRLLINAKVKSLTIYYDYIRSRYANVTHFIPYYSFFTYYLLRRDDLQKRNGK